MTNIGVGLILAALLGGGLNLAGLPPIPFLPSNFIASMVGMLGMAVFVVGLPRDDPWRVKLACAWAALLVLLFLYPIPTHLYSEYMPNRSRNDMRTFAGKPPNSDCFWRWQGHRALLRTDARTGVPVDLYFCRPSTVFAQWDREAP